jgi:hypothetical protein
LFSPLIHDSGGAFYVWGQGTHGQIGDGATSNVNSPKDISNKNAFGVHQFKSLALGFNQSAIVPYENEDIASIVALTCVCLFGLFVFPVL